MRNITLSAGNNRTLLILIGVVVVIICGGLFIVALAGAAYVFVVGRSVGIAPLPMTPAGPTSTPAPTSGVRPGDDLETQMAAIEETVTEMRGLEPFYDVPNILLTTDELRERVETDFFEDYTPEDARNDTLALSAFDFVPSDFDLYNFYIELYTEQVAGYYDPEADEVFVISENTSLSANDELTYAHEFVHLLQDQHYDLQAFMHYDDDDWWITHGDEARARSALVEGDATMLETRYINTFSQERIDELLDEYAQMSFPVLDSAPPFIARDLYFPYDEGLAFVQALYDAGGYDLVNAAFSDPPTSTEQILHPERYVDRDEPQAVQAADALAVVGDDYREVYLMPLGEFYLRLFLEEHLTASDAEQAAAGWDGDQVAVYEHLPTGEAAIVMLTVWDTPADADEFLEAFREFGGDWAADEPRLDNGSLICWGENETLCAARVGEDQTLIVRAPTADDAELILDQYITVPAGE